MSSDFYIEASAFLTTLMGELKQNNIVLAPHWDIDHLCYRVPTLERYEHVKGVFADLGTCLTESLVNGRPIATYKLKRPITYADYEVSIVELPAPKATHTYSEGFEHIEIVTDFTFNELTSRYGHSKFKTKSTEKVFNAELELLLQCGSIKFHHQSLESVIRLELQTHVFKAISDLQILHLLQEYAPLIAGTYPLGLQLPTSDLDIVIGGANVDDLHKELVKHFGEREQFDSYVANIQNISTVVARFIYQGVQFEIFGQKQPSVRQNGFQHFQIEEKLMKYRGEDFVSQVREYRHTGLKTEAAFIAALGVSGVDSFSFLAQMNKHRIGTLRSLN